MIYSGGDLARWERFQRGIAGTDKQEECHARHPPSAQPCKPPVSASPAQPLARVQSRERPCLSA